MRRSIVTAGLIVASLAAAAPASAINKPMALKLDELGGGRVRVDRGQLGSSVGDSIVLSHNLRNRVAQLSKGKNAEVGVSRGACTVLVTNVRWLCRWVFVLPNGQVQVSGLVDLGTTTAQLAVIGGTGAYNNTGGAAYRKPTGSNSAWTLRLVP
jgi:hypothetical protein